MDQKSLNSLLTPRELQTMAIVRKQYYDRIVENPDDVDAQEKFADLSSLLVKLFTTEIPDIKRKIDSGQE